MPRKLDKSLEDMRRELEFFFGDESKEAVTHFQAMAACKAIYATLYEIVEAFKK